MTASAGREEIQIGAGEPVPEGRSWSGFPYWLVALIALLMFMGYQVIANPRYRDAFDAIVPGITLTLRVTAFAFALSLVLGLMAGLGRVAKNKVIKNIATAYVEFIRGVPIIVLIFTIAFVVVPAAAEALGFANNAVSGEWRAIIALALIYGGFLAEVFRAGVESIPPGQMEAARSVGMTGAQAMRYIILPQAIRNVLPALGNDFIAMLKDSALVSLLAVREITQQARLYAGTSFRFRESYLVLTFLYLTMTLVLSLILQWYQRRLNRV